jgi:predicted ATPase with chaperone activity
LHDDARAILLERMRDRRLTARGLDRVRRIALTLLDLEGGDGRTVLEHHVCAALELRPDVLSTVEVAA